MSLRQSGGKQFHNLVPNAGKDLSFICNQDFCTKRLSAHRVVVKRQVPTPDDNIFIIPAIVLFNLKLFQEVQG